MFLSLDRGFPCLVRRPSDSFFGGDSENGRTGGGTGRLRGQWRICTDGFHLAPVCETRTIETNNVGLVSSFCETTGARNKGAGRENTMRNKNKVVEFFNIATRNTMGGG